jgi:hypothetical protein
MASTVKTPTGPELVKEDQAKSKSKPSRVLPFDRVQSAKQLEILRAYAAASNQGTKSVTNVEAAAIVGLAQETLSSCNAFFVNVGLIQKGDGGILVSPEVQSFFRAYDWNKDTAAQKLAPLLKTSWFAQAVLPTLSFKPTDEEEVIGLLADAAAAGRDCKRQLKFLIDYLEASGLIQRDGTLLRSGTVAVDTSGGRQDTPKEPASSSEAVVSPTRPRVATTFSQMAQGAMRFNVSFDVDLSEMAGWRADRIAAFFNGIAQVLAAKAEVEKTAGT